MVKKGKTSSSKGKKTSKKTVKLSNAKKTQKVSVKKVETKPVQVEQSSAPAVVNQISPVNSLLQSLIETSNSIINNQMIS